MSQNKRFPFTPYPQGWFVVAYSDELAVNGIVPLRYFGCDLVLYRGEDGEPHLADAHCPHLGAHLGHGGVVKGNSIQCPFHGWCYGADGACIDIPYSQRIPKRARLRKWAVREIGGMVLAYHGASEAHAEPDLPCIETMDTSWTAPRRLRRVIRTHVQEIAENSVDPAHFRYLHNAAGHPSCEISIERGILRSALRLEYQIQGVLIPAEINVALYGLGTFVTTARAGEVETLVVTSSTPIDDENIEVRLQLRMKRLGNELLTKLTELGTFLGLENNLISDQAVWENKLYRENPPLCDADRTIAEFRRWARQFYPTAASMASEGRFERSGQ